MAKKQQKDSEYPKNEKSGEGHKIEGDPNSAFLCHSSRDSDFVTKVAGFLERNFEHVYYYEKGQRPEESYWDTIDRELLKCGIFILFVGDDLVDKQIKEIKCAYGMHESDENRKIVTCLPQLKDFPKVLKTAQFGDLEHHPIVETAGLRTKEVAAGIMKALCMPFIYDGLPSNPHLFPYEKDIIEHFVKVSRLKREKSTEGDQGLSSKDIKKIRDKELDGCPTEWPDVERWGGGNRGLGEEYKQIVDAKEVGKMVEGWKSKVGSLRKKDAKVIVAALADYHKPVHVKDGIDKCCMVNQKMCFPEAGPRDFLHFPRRGGLLKVAILVSGGIAPGTNAVIDGIVQRHLLYATEFHYLGRLSIVGIKNGFLAFDYWGNNSARRDLKAEAVNTSYRASEGGSLLGTSRVDDLLDNGDRKLRSIVQNLYNSETDILYIIGGDGSMKAAHALWTVAQEYALENDLPKLSVVAIPKTMDNDILWVWQTFGFLSAVEKAREIIDHLATEVASNPRLCVVQLFGSDSGFVVSHAVLASRPKQCDAALIPEFKFTIKKLAEHLKLKMNERVSTELIRRGLVVMAETAIPLDAMDFVNDKSVRLMQEEREAIEKFEEDRKQKKRIEGQTSDELRRAGLKIVSRGLHKLLEKKGLSQRRRPKLRIVTNEPRHLLRALPPSCTDIIMGNRLGTLAVDNALAGYTDFMISQWLTEYVLVPLKLVVLGRKRIPETGIFWKSVIAKTGQPAKLT